jgi:hypothetical protein
MSLDMTTLTRVKAILAEGVDSRGDTLLAQLITEVSAVAESFMRRQALSASTTEYFDVGPIMTRFQVRGYPITSVTTIHNDPDRAYGSSTLVSSDDYAAYSDIGQIAFDYAMSVGNRALKIVYIGGMATSTANFITAFPDITRAIEAQVVHEFRRRKDPQDGTSVGQFLPGGGMTFLAYTETILSRHRCEDIVA